MIDNGAGEYIRKLRLEKNISSTKLSKGLCSVSMLSKIESGERYPDYFLLQSLVERMGESLSEYDILATEQEVTYNNLLKEFWLLKNTHGENEEELNELVDKIESTMVTKNKIQRQHFYHVKEANEKDIDKCLEYCKKGLEETISEVVNIDELLFSQIEFRLYNALAGVYFHKGNYSKSEDIWKSLEYYCKRKISSKQIKEMYLESIYGNLALLNIFKENYLESINYADKGIANAKKSSKTNFLFYNYAQKAYSLGKLGNEEAAVKMAPYFYYLGDKNDMSEEHIRTYQKAYFEVCNKWFEIEWE